MENTQSSSTQTAVSGPSSASTSGVVVAEAKSIPNTANQSTNNDGTASATHSASNGNGPNHSNNPSLTTESSSVSNVVDPSTTASVQSGENPPLPKPSSLKEEGRLLSASETALASKPTSVTPARKQELLRQARALRLEWIREVPFPYQKPKRIESKDVDDSDEDAVHSTEDPLAPLRETYAGRQLPAAMGVLEFLSGLPDRADEQTVQQITELFSSLEHPESVPTPEQARKMELEDNSTTETPDDNDKHRDSLLRAYHSFLKNLTEPPAAMLTQGMRNFCRNLSGQKHEEKETLFTIMKSYIASTYDAVRAHALWKDQMSSGGGDEEFLVRRSLESFIYGQCRSHIDNYLYDGPTQDKEKDWQERVNLLQFVTASHLEVECLQDETLDVSEVLRAPVKSLLSMSTYHSPFEKLQRILSLYRGINAALTKALNRAQSESTPKKLPSADDVLPTIILTVLAARPRRLHYNLQLIEDFCPPEYLRGEAGYAYTNLYGAIQFISGVDLGNSANQAPDSLTISAEEFQQGLSRCRAATQERLNASEQATASKEQKQLADTKIAQASLSALLGQMSTTEVTANDIRTAREQREFIGEDWPMQLHQEKQKSEPDPVDIEGAGGIGESFESDVSAKRLNAAALLPGGFQRSYNFLSHAPSDITVENLPQLLEEYRMMVHATEELLAERQAQANKDRKEQWNRSQMDLINRVSKVDPSLLPSPGSTAPSSKKADT